MERFAAMASSRRGAPAPPPAPADDVEVKKENQNQKRKKKKGIREENEAYLSIKLDEIIIVKNEDIGNPCAGAHGGNTLGSGVACNRASSTSRSMEQCATAATAPPARAARGAWTTVAKIVGFD